MHFLVRAESHLPPAMTAAEREALVARETARGRELVAAGMIEAIWRIPGRTANVAIWRCADADELHAALCSLPAYSWMGIDVTPLATHPLSLRADGRGDH